MRNIILIGLVSFGVSAQGELEKYKIDAAHTSVVFKVDHLGFSNVYGMLPGVEGTFVVNDAKPEESKIEVKVKADSITTNEAKRDKHLRSPDFFNVKQNPLITFRSKSVKKSGESMYQVAGELTLNGVTKPVTFDFKRSRTGKDPWGATRTGGETSIRIKRSDFKMNYMQGENQIGDEVELMISLEGVRE